MPGQGGIRQNDRKIYMVEKSQLTKATELIGKIEEVLHGYHKDCQYLALGYCNKCGANVNQQALEEIANWKAQNNDIK